MLNIFILIELNEDVIIALYNNNNTSAKSSCHNVDKTSSAFFSSVCSFSLFFNITPRIHIYSNHSNARVRNRKGP